MNKHAYPSSYGPDHSSPFIRMSWVLLDMIDPGAMSDEVRVLTAGMIAGALDQAYTLGKDGRSPEEFENLKER